MKNSSLNQITTRKVHRLVKPEKMLNLLSIFKHSRLAMSSGVFLSSSVLIGTVVFLIKQMIKKKIPECNTEKYGVVIITGCDSGLGYTIAKFCHSIGFVVFAGVLNCDSAGANVLKTTKSRKDSISVIKLDITNSSDIKNALTNVSEFLNENPNYYLHAVINNAGVMIFGEFEWLTDEMILQVFNVNLLGAINFTKVYIPLLRKHKGRIINVSSHCAREPLPGLSIYAASKSGLQAWNDAMRVEYAKYGIRVISFLPGSFFLQSNILSKQSHFASDMKAAMTEEAVEFYGDYFDRYQSYLNAISGDKPLQEVHNAKLLWNLTDALISDSPSSSYSVTPFRYFIYHFLFRVTPTPIRDYLVGKFVNMPTYKKS